MDREFLDKLLEQISVSGCEECGQEVVKSHMQPFSDEIWTDEMGDVICILNPESPVRVMLSAHADEIGLLVTRITEEGRIQAIERGGIIHQNYPGQKVRIHTQKGIVYGVVECSRELFKQDNLKASDFLIDIGATSKVFLFRLLYLNTLFLLPYDHHSTKSPVLLHYLLHPGQPIHASVHQN